MEANEATFVPILFNWNQFRFSHISSW